MEFGNRRICLCEVEIYLKAMSKLFIAIVISIFALAASARAEAHLDPARAIALMQAGGLNLYMRHAITDRTQRDTGRRGDRAGQRNLDARGKAQAAALGEAFKRLNITVTWVATSEVFRARDTAEIAFGAANVAVIDALIADDYTPRDPMADAMAVRQLLNRPPASGNATFVGHIIPFGLIIGRSFSQSGFAEGAVALVKPSAERPELIGIISAEAIITAAGLPTPWVR
jgi:phosphohistidine phosphatase SixA